VGIATAITLSGNVYESRDSEREKIFGGELSKLLLAGIMPSYSRTTNKRDTNTIVFYPQLTHPI
jgi:hypothetical protein